MYKMAEATVSNNQKTSEEEKNICPICLDTFVHPAKLPCGHIFCYLCIKGTSMQSQRCAMCRQIIPPEFIENPDLLQAKPVTHCSEEKKKIYISESDGTSEETYRWYYEGQNGWWQYDDRTNNELESAYDTGEKNCELLIAGMLYVVDFEANLQMRKNNPTRRRRIKRDLATIDKKGIAGLRDQNYSVNSNHDIDEPVHRRRDHLDNLAADVQQNFSVTLNGSNEEEDNLQQIRNENVENVDDIETNLNMAMIHLNFDDD